MTHLHFARTILNHEDRSSYHGIRWLPPRLPAFKLAAASTPQLLLSFGPRQSARAVIPTIITQIANGKRNIKLGSVSPTRDFNYIKDTVAGFLSALNSDQGMGEVVNLGTNYEISIGKTAKLIADLMGKRIEIISDEVRLRPKGSEVERLCADNTKAKVLFGWKPKYAGPEGFKNGIEETVKWFLEESHLRGYKSEIYNL